MPTRRFVSARLLCLALLSLAVPACNGSTETARGPMVLAASSLQEALERAGEAWAAQGRAAPVLSFAASSALARQVELGAPADLFVSADEAWMDTLDGLGLLRGGTRIDLLSNRLVLVKPKGGSVRGLADLGDGRIAMADPNAVPAGKYAKAALESLGQWQRVAAKAVAAENVRAALALVERGEAALGVVYSTDALASGAVEVIDVFPESSHPRIRYPAAILAGSAHPEAEAFLGFLRSDEARRIFAQHGFGIAE